MQVLLIQWDDFFENFADKCNFVKTPATRTDVGMHKEKDPRDSESFIFAFAIPVQNILHSQAVYDIYVASDLFTQGQVSRQIFRLAAPFTRIGFQIPLFELCKFFNSPLVKSPKGFIIPLSQSVIGQV